MGRDADAGSRKNGTCDNINKIRDDLVDMWKEGVIIMHCMRVQVR